MKGSTLSALAGLLLACIGLITMLGWYLQMPTLFSLPMDEAFTKFNSALEFFLAGFGLWLINSYPRNRFMRNISIIMGSLIFIIAATTISQNLFGYNLGIDNFFLQSEANLPVRMANGTALIFMLAGVAFIMLPYGDNQNIATALSVSIGTMALISITSLLTHSIDAWNVYIFMPFLTSLSAIALSLSLMLSTTYSNSLEHSTTSKEDLRILILNATIVLCFILLVGVISTALFTNNDSAQALKNLNERGFLISILAIIFGMFMLYWQVLPMIRSIIHSKRQLFAANQRLTESENRFRTAFDFAAVGMALISLGGRCVRVNQALCNMLGLEENEVLHSDLRIFRHPDDIKREASQIQQMLEGTAKISQSEQRFFHKNGDVIWVSVSMSLVSSSDSNPLYFIYQCQNITAEKKAEEKLRQMAYHDPLTGLANRNKLEQDMHQLIVSSQRTQPGFALIFLDLDHFKNINDTIGHDAGDILLQVVSERLRNTVRNTDMVARLGGDEFVLVITNVKKVESVVLIAQKILHNLLKPILIKGHEIYVTTSVGISFFPYDGHDIQTLMKNADLALYRAKEQGRNNYQFCTPEMTVKAQEKLVRQNALNHAMVKEEFYLFYQPKMDLQTGRISGVEALLRWKNNEHATVTTEEIISLAEESGLIVSLSEWILKTACSQVKAWHAKGLAPLTVAINLSPRQFKQVDFAESIINVLRETDFPPNNVELEITESLIMQDPENTLMILQQLKNANLQLAIDDFGTGYSSLSYLKRFAVDKIKIDKTFIDKLDDETNVAIITAMIAMAHKLGIKTLAEGIETQDQFEFLVQEKCSEMQGYYLSRPLSADDMTTFLTKHIHQVQLPKSRIKQDG